MSIFAAMPPARAAEVRLGPAALSVIGQDSLTFRKESISGDEVRRSAYRWDNCALAGSFEHRTDVVVHGQLLPGLKVDAALARGPYALGRQRLTFTYEGADATVKLGDVAVAFDGGELVEFRRSLRGIQVDSSLLRGALTLVASQSKPAVRTDTIYGRNLSGPYYLAACPVVDASEVVTVDGRPMQRGTDYSIDYQIGLVQFSPALIIPPTSQIAVTYEYDTPGGMTGRLVGLRAAYPVAAGLRVGGTYLTLQRQPAVAAAAAIEDRFLGSNSAGPFTLRYRPIEPGSERVRLDGILQFRERDYAIDYTTGAVLFRQPVPAGVSILISYRVAGAPQPSAPERSLVALDAHYADGRHLALDAEMARSVGGLGTSARGGAALGLGVRGEWDRLSLAANLRSCGAGFAPFESAGPQPTRRGYDWRLGFAPAEGLRLSAAARDYRRPYFLPAQDSTLESTDDVLVRDRSREFTLDFARPGWPSLSYAASWTALAGAAESSVAESNATHLLGIAYDRGVYGMKATYNRNSYARQGGAPASAYSEADYATLSSEAGLFSFGAGAYSGANAGSALSLWYRPGGALSITCDLARNSTTLERFTSSSAASTRLAVEYAPADNTSISLGYRASSADETMTADGRSVPRHVDRSQVVTIRHNPAANLSLNLTYDTQVSEGGYATNTRSNTCGFGAWWQPARTLGLTGQYTRQNLTYLGAAGRWSNEIASVGATVGPLAPGLKLELSCSRMSGTGGGFGTSDSGLATGYTQAAGAANSSARARLSYDLGGGQEAFTEWETSANSGYPGGARRRVFAVGWQVAIGGTGLNSVPRVNFTLDWRRTASDSADSRYSYRAQTLSGEVGIKF